jgi:membrane-associated phospholipid phosphatase
VTYSRHLFLATNFLKRLALEVAYAILYCFLLFVLLLSWFIGITRFWDNRHNISDILGGFMIGVIFSTPAFLGRWQGEERVGRGGREGAD